LFRNPDLPFFFPCSSFLLPFVLELFTSINFFWKTQSNPPLSLPPLFISFRHYCIKSSSFTGNVFFPTVAKSYYNWNSHALVSAIRSSYKDYHSKQWHCFFLFANIWVAGTSSQVQFPMLSRKSLPVDNYNWGLVIVFNYYKFW